KSVFLGRCHQSSCQSAAAETSCDTDRIYPRSARICAIQDQKISGRLSDDFGDDEGRSRRIQEAPKARTGNEVPGKNFAGKELALERHQDVEIAAACAAKPHGCSRALRRPAICPCKCPCLMLASNVSTRSSRSAWPGGLSQRSRLMRGKRIARPDL